MGKKAQIVKIIAKHGCGGIPCSGCPLSKDGHVCDTYSMPDVQIDSPEIKAQAERWLEERAKRKAEKKVVITYDAKNIVLESLAKKLQEHFANPVTDPAWDGKFVPGEFYQSFDGVCIVLCQDGKPNSDNSFYGVIVKGVNVGEEYFNSGWIKKLFRPVKVKITVEE